MSASKRFQSSGAFERLQGPNPPLRAATVKASLDLKRQPVTVLGLTGSAASRIGGTTLHSWAGIGTGKGSLKTIRRRIKKHEGAEERMRAKDLVIILDE